MSRARCVLQTAAFIVLVCSLAAPARAVVAPEGGQANYEMPLRAFDLFTYRSATTDAERASVESALTRAHGGAWAVYAWNPQSHTPSEMYGSGADVAAGLSSPEAVQSLAERLIRENAETFKADLAGLRFREVTSMPPVTNSPDGVDRVGKWAAHFRQVYHGIDVVGGEVHMTFTDAGRLFALGSTYFDDISVDWTPRLSSDEAKEISRAALPFNPETDSVEADAKLLVLPVPTSVTDVEHHLVWETKVRTEEPLGIWVTSVDAQSGEILLRRNDVSFVNYLGNSAEQVERYSFCDGTNQEWNPYAYISVLGVGATYADAYANWYVPYDGGASNTLFSRLLSPYVDVQNSQGTWAGIFTTVFPGVPFQVNFNDTNSRADERDVFKTINDVHDFFQTFAPGFAFANQLMTARVNIANSCNAYWDGTINFYQAGGGCGNTGQMMDVVAHEYGHGIQQAILGGQGNEGLGEGNGDVIGFLMSGSSMIGRGFYDCTATGGIRDANNTLRYPENVVGQEIHAAGRVIAGFHWDAMQDQIAEYGSWGRYSTAYDWHWGRALQLPMTQPAQVLATFIANDNDGNLSNGTPQFNAYCLGATNHGFTCPSALLTLAAGGCDTYYQGPQGFKLNQQNNYWTVVGVSPSPGDDKDISVYTAGYGTQLASSQGVAGADFVVGDFNHNALGEYWPYVSYGDAASQYVTEWDSGPEQVALGTDIFGTVGGGGGNCGLVRAWDVFLVAGRTYTVSLFNWGGTADMRLSLFRNPAAAPYWVGRSSSVLEVQADNSILYTAPTSDWYGVVVFNNSEGSPGGTYALRIEDAPTLLANSTCQTSTVSPRMFSFTQPFIYWTGVAVNPSAGDDKDISVYADPGGASSPLATSQGTSGTDFVMGDFNHNATGTYYSRISYGSTSATYVTDWDSGQDAIYPGTDVTGTVGGGAGDCGVLKVYDLFLTEGQQYRFLILNGGAADIHMSLFRNPSDGTYWSGRSDAEFEIGNSVGYTYTAPASDWYGVAVFNNSLGSPAGSYTLRVRDFPPALAHATCLTAIGIPQIFTVTQPDAYWSAVAINPTGVDDKDIIVYDNPDGLGAGLGYSTGTVGTDFVIGDFNHMIPGMYHPLSTYGDQGSSYGLEWDSGPDIFPIGPSVNGTVGGVEGDCNLIEVWDVFLEAGTSYPFTLTTAGDADIRVSLFRNPASGAYWAGRFNAEFEVQAAGTPYDYLAPASDYYGLVVFNASPDSPAGSYTLQIGGTTAAPEDVVDGKPGLTFQNPYSTGSPILLRAASDGAAARVGIYNVEGRLVRTLLNEPVGRTVKRVSWDGRADGGAKLGAGVYLVRAQIGEWSVNTRLLMLK